MLVYTNNRLLRLPWCTKAKLASQTDSRPFVPVLNGLVHKELNQPIWDIFKRVLLTYGIQINPFAYPQNHLEQKKTQKKTIITQDDIRKELFFPQLATQVFIPPKSIKEDADTIINLTADS